jgi:hypothetical protein
MFVISKITQEISQEKVSKSIEYVLTSVSAKEYLLAKVLSTTITVAVQILFFIVYFMIGNYISVIFADSAGIVSIDGSTSSVIVNIVKSVMLLTVYIVLTVILLSSLQAVFTSKTTSTDEAGITMMFLTFLLQLLMIIGVVVVTSYTTSNVVIDVLTCLPIVSVFFIPQMLAMGVAKSWQIVVSLILLILAIPLVFNTCSQKFKNGILDYTTKKSKPLIKKKELNLREKQDYEFRVSEVKKFAFVIGMAMILYFVVMVVLSLILGVILPSTLGGKASEEIIYVIENGLILIASLGIASAFINSYLGTKKEAPKKIKGKEKFEIIFIGIAFFALIQIASQFIAPKLGLDYNILSAVTIGPNNPISEKIIYIISLAVVPAIFEELFFRKAILNASKRFGNAFAVIFSALLFGIYHMNLSQGIFAFFVGILFGIIAIKTNSIKYTGLLHFLNNAYASLIAISVEDSIAYGIFNDIVFALVIVGIIVLIKNLPKLKKLKREDFKINKDCTLIIRNYTFIVAMIMFIVMFIAVEHMLRIGAL